MKIGPKICAIHAFVLLLVAPILIQITYADESEPHFVQLQEYKPIYFITGTPDTKVQFSFKGQLVREIPFYFAYTQLLMWDLFKKGAPISDVNFNPELFYRVYTSEVSNQWLDFGIFEHESNGHGANPQERSWNRASLTYHSGETLGEKSRVLWSFKAWLPFTLNSNNSDLSRYRGIWELQMTLVNLLGPFFEANELSLRLYPGGPWLSNPIAGGQELTLKTKINFKPFLPFFVMQIFHGYGENLLNYNDERTAFRVGIGF